MLRRLLKRAALTFAALIVVAVLAALVWWRVAGKSFLYGVILPDAARLLEGQEIPDELDAEAFREDLAFLGDELPRLHVAYESAFRPEQVSRRLGELAEAADRLTPVQRALELTGLVASGRTGTGHTMVFPFQPALDWRIYPLSTYWFDDGLFVTAAERSLEHAVGSRIVRIGGVPASNALEKLAPYVSSDNPSSLRGNIPRLLGMAEPLIALGLAAPDGTLELELEASGVLRVDPTSLTSWRGMRWSRAMFAPSDAGWSPADPRRRSRNYGLDYRPDSKLLYVAVNELENQGDESLAQFAGRLDAFARGNTIEKLVIDLRANGGGNNELARPLVDVISDHPVLDRPGMLYVLIGRRTFSAAANLACALERRTKAIFVGESSGFTPNHYGDAVSILLPGSKIVTRIASRRWQEDLPGVDRTALEPDLPVRFLSSDHFAGVDPALEAVANHSPSTESQDPGRLPADALGSYLLSPLHRVRLFTGDGRDRLAIDAAGPYAITDLHLEPSGSFATDIRGLSLDTPDGSAPTLHWHGASFPLERVEDAYRLPFERLLDGDLDAGAEGFRSAAGSITLGSDFELAINRIAYEALGSGRTDDAITLFALNTELFPGSANTFDGLGDGLKAAGRIDEARNAYRQALERAPAFGPSIRSLAELSE